MERRGRKGTQDKQVMHYTTAHYPLIDIQPVPEQRLDPFPGN